MPSGIRPKVLKFAYLYVRFVVVCLGGVVLLLLICWAGAGHWQAATGRYVAVVAFALILLFYRCWRMGVRFDEHGVRIRGLRHTDRYGWPEVSHFADGRTTLTDGTASADFWALAVVLRDGRTITVKATAAWPRWPTWRGPKMRAAIAQVAARHQIPAELTGVMPPPAPVVPWRFQPR